MEEETILARKGLELDLTHSKKRLSLPGIQILLFLFGMGLLCFFIYYTGIRTISDAFIKIGWGSLIILGLNGARHLLRAYSLYLAIPLDERTFGYPNIVATRLGGDAVSILSFTGPLLGEATKATLLKRWMPLSKAVTSVVIDNIVYDISVGLVILSGAGLLFFTHEISSNSLIYGILGTAILTLISVLVLIFLIQQKIRPVSWLVEKSGHYKYFPDSIIVRKAKILTVEDSVYTFYFRRRSSFFVMLAINLFTHLLSVSEVCIALYLLGYEPGLANSFIIESLTKIINFVFGFVPATIGVYEGGNGLILHTLGFATATGVVLGLTRKGAIIFWTMVGLLILVWKGSFRIISPNVAEN